MTPIHKSSDLERDRNWSCRAAASHFWAFISFQPGSSYALGEGKKVSVKRVYNWWDHGSGAVLGKTSTVQQRV